MPNKKYTYTITTSDGKSHQVSKENIDKYGMKAYADAYKGATVRMRDKDKADYDIPIEHYNDAVGQGLHPFTFEHTIADAKPQTTPTAPKPTQSQPKQGSGQGKGTPMTAAYKQQAMNFAAGISAQAEEGKHRFDNQMEYLKHNTGLDVKPVRLGQNRKVTPIKQADGKTKFITETGNEYDTRGGADLEQNTIDREREERLHPIETQLRDAYDERDRLNERLAQLGKEEDKKNDTPLAQLASASNVTGGLFYGEELAHKRDMNDEYRQLHAAADQNRQRIVALEAERDKANAGFWRGAADALKDPTIWDFGYTDAITAQTLLSVANKGNKRKTEADNTLMGETFKNQQAQNEYAANRGAMYRFGQIGAKSIPFMAEFMLMGGADAFGSAGAKLGAKAAAKLGMDGAMKTAMKYTGTALSELAASNVLANTMQGGTTGKDIVNRALGNVKQDKDGNYQFEGGDDWGTAIYKGQMAATLENYTEMLGGHLSGKVLGGKVLQGLDKIGLSSVSNAFRKAGSSQYAQLANKVLEKGGFNGYFNEVAEEEANIILNSALVGDNKLSDLVDGRTQLDIWGGLLFSCGAMEAVPRAMGAADYYRAKRKVGKADRVADFRLTHERWQPLREQIDQTPNENIAEVAENIINDDELHPQEKQAALDYMGQLIRFRGFNTATTANAEEKSENGEQSEEDVVEQGRNNAYMQGHDAADQQKNDIKTRYEYTRQQVRNMFGMGEQDDIDEVMNRRSPVEMVNYLREQGASEEQLQTALDYYNAQAAYQGMIDGVRDKMEDAVEESDNTINSRVHNEDGMIHPATMKAQDENGNDRKVYVIGGNIQMMDDGSMVDTANSDESIIIRDAETGKIEFADPKDVLSVDEPLDAEEERQAAAETIRQEYAQREGDMIDGVLPFNEGDQYSIVDEQGQQHTVQVVGEAVDEQGQPIQGAVTVMFDGQQAVLPKDQLQQMSDAETISRLNASLQQRAAAQQEQATQQQATEQSAAQLPFALNDEFTMQTADGQTVRGNVTAEQNEDGQIEVYTEDPVNGNRVNLYTPEELQSMVTEYNGEAYEQPQAATETQEAGQTVNNGETTAAEVTESPATPVMEEQQPTAEPMPMVKDNNGEDTEDPDFSAVEPSRTHTYIMKPSCRAKRQTIL